MPRVTYKFVTKHTRAERKAQRRFVRLEDASLTDSTRARYATALLRLVPTLETVHSLAGLDFAVTDWIEEMWEAGEPQYVIADALSGLHYYEPWTKREVPSRAPPLTSQLIRSMAAYAIDHRDLLWACILLVGFYALLRTGEILQLCPTDFLVADNRVVISLQNTKTGKRKACQEAVHVDDALTVEVIQSVLLLRKQQNNMQLPLWPYSGSSFRKRFAVYCQRFGLQKHGFRPYSLRRGGATHHFQMTRSMESALLLGRWESVKVARLYISDALSFIPQMQYSHFTREMLKRYPSPL